MAEVIKTQKKISLDDVARVAFESYYRGRESVEGSYLQKLEIKQVGWDEMDEDIKEGWRESAAGVLYLISSVGTCFVEDTRNG